MPIFEFHCESCKEDFERIVLNTNTKVKCPHCESGKVKKKLSAFSFKSGGKMGAASASSGCSSCAKPHCSTCH